MNWKEYFDEDYYVTPGKKSGYDYMNFTRDSYLYEAMVVWLNEFIPLAGKRILEVGCACGWLVEELVRNNFDAYGQDISKWATEHCPEWISDRIRECYSTEIAFEGKFDLILSFETMEHVPMEDVEEYIRNMYDALNEGGIWFGTICLGHNNDRGDDPDESHQTLQPRAWWNERFEKVGFLRRWDLEAEAYEIGVQTSRMESGQFLPRYYNWHVFAFEKSSAKSRRREEKYVDRRVLFMVPSESRPKLLVFGSRLGEFRYPVEDFFHIDNWGNYLSYFFEAEYRTIADENWKEIEWEKYDLVMCALDHNVVAELQRFFPNWKRAIGFMDGTLPMMFEEGEHREKLLKTFPKFDVICSHQPGDLEAARVFGVETVECGHIFPLRWFDSLYPGRVEGEGFSVLCAGVFDSRSALVSYSAFLASRCAESVYISIDEKHEPDDYEVPRNCVLFKRVPQHRFYREILPHVDVLLRMDNPRGVGRAVAEAAATSHILSIAPKDVFQVRCFPELVVESVYDVGCYERLLKEVAEDGRRFEQLRNMSRKRLEASNEAEFRSMLTILQSLGFEVGWEQCEHELYW